MVKSEPASDIKRPKFIKPVKVLVVVAPYYKEIADDLVAGATEEISASGAEFEIVNVPERSKCQLQLEWLVAYVTLTRM